MSDRFRVQLAYDGTDFSGSQYQPELRTVQGELEGALAKIGWQGKRVLFAGRTDAGVHAAGQVAAFDLDWGHTEEELTRALNAVLPPDIAAAQILRTRNDFQPRYEALSREYHYRILISPTRDPLQERYCWRVWPELDLSLMKRESRYLIGSHDFAALGTPHQPGGCTVREIKRARWHKNGNGLIFKIVGNAFLYHMVRRIVIALVKIGEHKEPGSGIKDYLDNPSGPPAQGLAPARGIISGDGGIQKLNDRLRRTINCQLVEYKIVKKTFYPKSEDITRKWVLVDAEGKNLGRLSTVISKLILGKHKAEYTPGVDTGDYVVVINAEKFQVTGKKMDDKYYYRESKYQGGLKKTSLRNQLEKRPEYVIEHAVKGMLPHTRLGRQLNKKLKVYAGPDHPHQAQHPVPVEELYPNL